MLLFDIGAILFIAGMLNFLYFAFAPRFKDSDPNGRLGVTNKIVVVEMVNKFFDFYASAFVAIRNAVEQIEPNLYYIEILNIIID